MHFSSFKQKPHPQVIVLSKINQTRFQTNKSHFKQGEHENDI